MKKWLKIILGIIGIIILSILIDLICIFTINKPIFAIKEDNGDSVHLIYRGLFFDTYNCHEYSVPQIKAKGTKFTCAVLSITENNKIEVVKPQTYETIKFKEYLKIDNKTVCLAGNIEEVYYTNSETKATLKDYITKTWQTFDDSINDLTDLMEINNTLKDGGTTIYKSKKYDITLVKCNTIKGNKNIFIGDYYMKFDSNSMCK